MGCFQLSPAPDQPHRWATLASSHPALPLRFLSLLSPGLAPCQRPLGAITAEHCCAARVRWLIPGDMGRCASLLTTAKNKGREGARECVSYWIDEGIQQPN